MTLTEVSIILVRGMGVGAIYALIAMSFNIVFKSSGILNFAQGNMLIAGGFVAYLLLGGASTGVAFWAMALLIAALAVASLITVQGWITLAPLENSAEQLSWLISTMGFSIILTAVLMLTQGPYTWTVESPFPSFMLLGTRTPASYALALAAMVFWFFLLRWFLSRTRLGLAISAVSQDVDAARSIGLRVRRIQLSAFAISGVIVGSTGFIVAPVTTLAPDSGLHYVLHGFIVAVIGGLGSNSGAVLGGLALGVISMFVTFRVGGQYEGMISLLILIGVLMVRPEGVFGRTTARQV